MKSLQPLCLMLIGLALIPGAGAAKETTNPYVEMAAHYEAIRLILLADSIEGLTDYAIAIEDQAQGLLDNITAAGSGVSEQDAVTLEAALEEIQSAASDLATSDSLDSARERFFALTKPLTRYRKLSGDETTIVAYCPMAQKAWIQPEGEIGNPYMGHSMPMCGEVVGE